MQEQLTQAEGKIKLQDEMIGVLNETVKEVKSQLEEEKKKAEQLAKVQKEKLEEIAKLKARIAELEAELEIAKARIRELEKQLAMHLKVMEGKKKEGWLQKLSPAGNKRLQKRWFVLKGVTLIYHKNDKESSKPLGSIDLTKTRVYSLTPEESKKKCGAQFGFEIIYLDRGYVLAAPTEQDRKDWVEALSKVKIHFAIQENLVTANTNNSSISDVQIPEGFDADNDDDD